MHERACAVRAEDVSALVQLHRERDFGKTPLCTNMLRRYARDASSIHRSRTPGGFRGSLSLPFQPRLASVAAIIGSNSRKTHLPGIDFKKTSFTARICGKLGWSGCHVSKRHEDAAILNLNHGEKLLPYLNWCLFN
jgi:hypothetical protein